MFKVWNGHHISLCGLMILIAAGPSPATRLGHRDEVPLGDLMCRLQNITPASPSARSRTTFCVRASQATARSVEYIERRADLARKTKRAPDHVFLWRASRAFQIDFTGLSRMGLMRL